MDETRNREHEHQAHSRRDNSLGRIGSGAIACCCLCFLACSVVPDSIALEGGHTFNKGDHLGGAWNPDRLTNDGNEDSNYVGLTLTYHLKPRETKVINYQEFSRPQWWQLDQQVRPFREPLPLEEPRPDNVDLLDKGLGVIEDTSWSTIEKIVYLSTALSVLGVVFFGLKVKFKKK